MSLTPLNPKGWPAPRGYANGLAGEGRLVILGGQIGWDPQGRFAEGFVPQVRQALSNIAAVLAASIDHPASPPYPAIYNVCDDEAAPPEDVIAHAARLLGLPVPPAVPFEEAELSAMARSFYAESKRVANRRIREELTVRLRYPTYREGLAALLAAEGKPPLCSPPTPFRSGEGGTGG